MPSILYVQDSTGAYRAANTDELLAAARSAVRDRFQRGTAIKSPTDAVELIRSEIGHLEHEVFAVAYFDNRHRLLAFDQVFRGTIDGTSVYPREICKEALRHNAAAICLAHNHPSGNCEPSGADERITRRLKSALELVDIRVLDHIIVGGDTHMSFAERGMI